MVPVKNNFFTGFFSFSLFLALLTGCGLKYQPQTPPETRQLQRQDVIEAKIQEEFAARGMKYKSIAFGNTVTVKPASFIKLDSLFEQKYQLELQGKTDRKLDDNIQIQRLICQNDTNEILYMEDHVFSLQKDSTAEVFSGKFALNARNELRDVQFTQSINLPADLVQYYTYYILGESFIHPAPGDSEMDFYQLYKSREAVLTGGERDKFLNHTMTLMKIARTRRSLEKQMFLEELSKREIQGKRTDYKDEVFPSVSEVVKANNEVDYYMVVYQFSRKTGETSYVKEKYELRFDTYLMLISKEQVPL